MWKTDPAGDEDLLICLILPNSLEYHPVLNYISYTLCMNLCRIEYPMAIIMSPPPRARHLQCMQSATPSVCKTVHSAQCKQISRLNTPPYTTYYFTSPSLNRFIFFFLDIYEKRRKTLYRLFVYTVYRNGLKSSPKLMMNVVETRFRH